MERPCRSSECDHAELGVEGARSEMLMGGGVKGFGVSLSGNCRQPSL